MIRAIIFDYFGVIRSDRIRTAYREMGGDAEKDADFIHQTLDAANRGLIPGSRQVFAERLGVSVEVWLQAVTGKGNDRELLTFIKKLRPKYKIGLLSNVSRGGLELLFESGEVEEYFDVVLGSGDVGLVKPDPRFYLMMCEKLGVKPAECVMVDDKLRYCEAARELGMQAVWYKDFAQFQVELEKLLSAET